MRSAAALIGLLPALALAPVVAGAAPSEDTMEPITVTAEKQPATLDKTPLSIEVISGDGAAQRGLDQLDELMAGVGGVKILQGAAGPSFYIRGIGTGVPPSVGDPEINLNIDGVYQSQPEYARAGLYDIRRVEVLRGPQGTLYGRNALAGVVNVVTNDPVFHPDAAAALGVGDYGRLAAQGMVNVPVGDTLAVRAAFSSQKRDGYLSNGADDERVDSQRIKLLLRPDGPVALLLAVDHTREGGQGEGEIQVVAPPAGFPTGTAGLGNALASANPWTSPDPGDAARHVDFWNTRLTLDWDLGFGLLTVLPAYRYGSNTCLNCWRSETDQNNAFSEHQATVEVRLASAPQAAVSWIAGAYTLKASDPSRTEQLGPGASSFDARSGNLVNEQGQLAFDSRSHALFGQATYPWSVRLRMTGGLRYSVDRKDEAAYVGAEQNGTTVSTTGIFTGARTWQALTYTAGLAYDLGEATLAYARLATGYKAGGFFEGAAPNDYAPEHLQTIEVGARARLLDGRLDLDANVFVYDYRDYQINYLGYIHPIAAGIFGVLTANASGARTQGAELALRYRLRRDDEVELAAYPLHTRFKTLVIDGPFGGTFTGLPLPFAPRVSANLAYEHRQRLASGAALSLRLATHLETTSWVSYSEAPGTRQPGHAVSDILIGYRTPGRAWSISAYVRNLANTPVLANAQGGPAGLEAADIGPPRTIGLELGAQLPR